MGFDVVIDKNLKAWLVEINDNPSMTTFICQQEMACTHKNCPVSPVDKYVKTRVLCDTIDLMLEARNLGGVCHMGKQFR